MAGNEEQLVVDIVAKLNNLEKQMARANQITARAYRDMSSNSKRATKQMEDDAIRSSIRINQAFATVGTKVGSYSKSLGSSVVAPLAGIGAALSVSALIQYADKWSDINARVGTAAGSMDAAAPVMERLAEIARRTYSDLGQTAESYIANADTLRALGYTTQQTLDYTEALNNALVVSGAKGDKAASVMAALSKAMALGKLSGDNLNTVIATGGRVAQALADSMGVSVLELRKLGSEGKITRDKLFGITNELEKLRKEADAMPATVADAFGQLNNSVLLWVGGMDEASGASAKLASAILSLADNFGTVADVALDLATILGGALAGRAIVGLIGATGTAITSVGALVSAMRAGSVTAVAFNAALGPIGLTIGAVAAGILLFSNNQSAAEKSAERLKGVIDLNATALDTAKDASGRYTQALRDQIAMQLEAALASAEMARAEYAAAEARASGFRQMTGGVNFAPFEYAANAANANASAVEGAAIKIEQQLARIDKAGVSKPIIPTDTGGKKTKTKAEKDDAYDKLTQSIIDRTAALVAETEAQRQINPLLNDYGYAAEKARMAQELLNAAHKAGKEITPELKKEIENLSEQYAQARVEAAKLAEAQNNMLDDMEFRKDVMKGVLGDLRSALSDGKLSFKELGDIALSVLDKIINKIEDDLINSLFKMNSAAGGGGGIFGGIFGGMFGGGQSAIARNGGIGMYANGTNFAPGGAAIVGERGPELVNLPRGSQVVPNHRMGQSGNGGQAERQNVHVTSDVKVSVDQSGNLQAYVQAEATKITNKGINGFVQSGHFTTAVGRAVPQAGMRGLLK